MDIRDTRLGPHLSNFEQLLAEEDEPAIEIEDYIEENRERLSDIIKAAVPNMHPSFFDADGQVCEEEIRQWVLNDEGLYNEAIRAGVAI